MKIDPTNGALYTDSGHLLKILKCPLHKTWDSLGIVGPGKRHCDSCERNVHDTSGLSDDDLLGMIQNDPDICLKVSPRQNNCTVLPIALRNRDG
jgi:hypothetical protein